MSTRDPSAQGPQPAPDFFFNSPDGWVRGDDMRFCEDADAALDLAREQGGVIAGMLPCFPGEPERLGVPTRWVTSEDPQDGVDAAPWAAGVAAARLPEPTSIDGVDDPAYRRIVGEALVELYEGDLEKVVLSRQLRLGYDAAPLSPAEVFRRLREQHPSAYAFSVADPQRRSWHLGASPELVMSVRDAVCATFPLAGSAPRAASGDPTEDAQVGEALMRSPKDRAEHTAVVEDLAERLRPLCLSLEVPAVPSLVRTPQLWHLGTRITGRLRPGLGSLEAARAIHPTPAICGVPREAAIRRIRETESAGRGFFGGLVGWSAPSGDGQWALNLRSARVQPDQAVLFAGAGVVRGSTPEGEHAETVTKLSTFLRVLGLDREGRPRPEGA